MSVQQAIETKLRHALAPAHLEILNESNRHAVPPGSETHFKVVVVSDAFEGKSRVARHQRVNGILAAGLLVAGVAVPWVAAALARSAGRRQAALRGALTANARSRDKFHVNLWNYAAVAINRKQAIDDMRATVATYAAAIVVPALSAFVILPATMRTGVPDDLRSAGVLSWR